MIFGIPKSRPKELIHCFYIIILMIPLGRPGPSGRPPRKHLGHPRVPLGSSLAAQTRSRHLRRFDRFLPLPRLRPWSAQRPPSDHLWASSNGQICCFTIGKVMIPQSRPKPPEAVLATAQTPKLEFWTPTTGPDVLNLRLQNGSGARCDSGPFKKS